MIYLYVQISSTITTATGGGAYGCRSPFRTAANAVVAIPKTFIFETNGTFPAFSYAVGCLLVATVLLGFGFAFVVLGVHVVDE